MIGVDELVVARRHVGEDAEPAERIDALISRAGAVGDRLAARPVEAVAAGDEVAVDALPAPSVRVGDGRRIAVDVVQRHVGRLADDLQPALRAAAIRSRVSSVWP